MQVKWKSKTSNGDLVHYYAYPITDVMGTPCVGLTILTLTKEPQKYFGGKVERIFFGKALYVVNEIHTLETYRTLTDAIDHILRMESRGQDLGNGESKMSKYIDAEKLIERLEEMKRAEYENCGGVNSKTGVLYEVQELIESLQQEHPSIQH